MSEQSSQGEPITVGYWSIRGLASPLRMMVMYSGRPLNNVMYDVKVEDGKYDCSEWFTAKKELKKQNPLINLPYIIDGNRLISQTNACFSYLGRKLDMWGSTEDEAIECEQLLCEIMDLRNTMVKFAYCNGPLEISAAQAVLDNVTGKNGVLQKLELWLERAVTERGFSGTFLVGDKATAPDFHLYEMLLQYTSLATFTNSALPLANFPRLSFFLSSFQALPANAKFLASNIGSVEPLKLPFNNKMASYGATNTGTPWEMGSEYDFHTYTGLYC
mmetsp:Transcript_15871/g.23904  ORF Transcript_15871/g.23904 Transcript_15871/m.23904 type:complete len:274 (-) Transcript_15871:139-960(-)